MVKYPYQAQFSRASHIINTMETFMSQLDAEPPQRGGFCVKTNTHATHNFTRQLPICRVYRNVSHNPENSTYFS